MLDDPDYPEDLEYGIRVKQRPTARPERRIKRGGAQLRAEIAERDDNQWAGNKGYTRPRRDPAETFYEVAEENRAGTGFNPTVGSLYSARTHLSNHEREWILNYLGGFYTDHLISDVLRRVKGGKEATVYCCRADSRMGGGLLAGKVYHERIFRSLKNDALYREGRSVLDEQGKPLRGRREALAMQKKTRFGQDMRQVTWLASEFEALRRLHAAGADVPRPLSHNDNAILMEYVGEEEWPAPPLVHVTLSKAEARPLFERLVHNVELMLAHNLVHGDLSAHNVLYWEGEIRIIDFPQAVDPLINSAAAWLLERDVARVCQYFTRYGVETDAAGLARDLWARHMRG